MSGSRSHFFSAVLGGLVVAVVMAVLPAVASDGDVAVMGTTNKAGKPTKIVSRNATQFTNTKDGRPAIRLYVQPGTPPMGVNSAVRVDNLNADLFDGLDSLGIHCPGCEGFSERSFAGGVMPGSNLAGAKISNADFFLADLSGSNLSGLRMSYPDFTLANLKGTDFSASFCGIGTGVYFVEANLVGADMTGFECIGGVADFSDADLTEATIVDASIHSGSFDGALCFKTDFTGSDLEGTSFVDANLHKSLWSGTTRTSITWGNTICPDGTNSDDNFADSCEGHLLGS